MTDFQKPPVCVVRCGQCGEPLPSRDATCLNLDCADMTTRAAAQAMLNLVLGKYGWRFINSKSVKPLGTIEYVIARIADDQRAFLRRTIQEIVEESTLEIVGLPISLWLVLRLVGLARETDIKDGVMAK